MSASGTRTESSLRWQLTHGDQSTREIERSNIKHGAVTNVGQTSEMGVLERLVQHVIWVVVHVVQSGNVVSGLCNLAKLFAEVDALLVGDLRRLREQRCWSVRNAFDISLRSNSPLAGS